MRPAVSVVIPAHRASRFLAEALDSVRAQSAPVAEIIVVDDGLCDETAQIARCHPAAVTLVRQARRGAGAARNAGIRASSGQMLAFLDADDLWHPEKIARQLAVADVAAGRAMAFGFCSEFSDPPGAFPSRGALFPAPSLSTLLIARDLFEKIGWLREDLAVGELLEWLCRPAASGVAQEMVPGAKMRRRVHADNMTRVAGPRAADYLHILRERRRREVLSVQA